MKPISDPKHYLYFEHMYLCEAIDATTDPAVLRAALKAALGVEEVGLTFQLEKPYLPDPEFKDLVEMDRLVCLDDILVKVTDQIETQSHPCVHCNQTFLAAVTADQTPPGVRVTWRENPWEKGTLAWRCEDCAGALDESW